MQTSPLRRAAKSLVCAIMAAAILAGCASTAPAPQRGPPQAAIWQRHQAMINYYGLTALYSCSGLEDKVRELLLYLGARPDLKVHAAGCDRAFDRPGHFAAVDADFYTLAAASDSAAGTVGARWKSLVVRPMSPMFMGYGECELLEQIKSVVVQDFSSRDLRYRTACIPHDETIADYDVHGSFLAALAQPAAR